MYITFKKLRLRNNLRCDEVAKLLDITESAYRKYERSARLPSAEKLMKMKEVFGCTELEIMEALDYHTKRKTK